MWIPKSELPEPILVEIRRVTSSGRHSSEARRWMILAAVLYGILIVGAALFASRVVGVSALRGVAITAPAGWLILTILPSRWSFTTRELRARLPMVRLAPVHAAYLEAMIEANDPGAPRALRDEILPALRRLADASDRLDLSDPRAQSDSPRAGIDRAALAALEIVRRFCPRPEGAAPVSESDLALLRENADGLWREVIALEAVGARHALGV